MTRHSLARRIVSLLMAPVAGLALSITAASPAHAAAIQMCPAGAFCLWKGTDGNGALAFYRASNIGNGARLSGSFAAQASSMLNRSPFTVRAYATPDCTGSPLLYENFGPGSYASNLSSYGLNNVIRSVRIPGIGQGPC